LFSAFGAIKENPGREIGSEIDKQVLLPCGYGEDVSLLDNDVFAATPKSCRATGNDVNLIAGMGLLPIGISGGVKAYGQASQLEQFR
jgi:hypothetical protein